jgi:hypothetical protein
MSLDVQAQGNFAAFNNIRASTSLSRAGVLSQLVQGAIDPSSTYSNSIPQGSVIALNAASGGGVGLISAAPVPGNAVLKGYKIEVLQTGGVGTITQIGVFSAQNNLVVNAAAVANQTGFDFVPLINIAAPVETGAGVAGNALSVNLANVQTIQRTVLDSQLINALQGTNTEQFLGLTPTTAGITQLYGAGASAPYAPQVGQAYVLAARGTGITSAKSSIILSATFDVYSPDNIIVPV